MRIAYILSCIILIGVIVWQQFKISKARTENTALNAEIVSNNEAWEKGLDDQQESYEMQLLTAYEKIEDLRQVEEAYNQKDADCLAAQEELADFKEETDRVLEDITRVANERMTVIYELRAIVKNHDENCLPHVSLG